VKGTGSQDVDLVFDWMGVECFQMMAKFYRYKSSIRFTEQSINSHTREQQNFTKEPQRQEIELNVVLEYAAGRGE
jgi:hypothetical protein